MPAIPLLMFPREQIEFAMEEAGYETPSKFAKKLPEISKANIPKNIKGYRHISYKESAIKERSKPGKCRRSFVICKMNLVQERQERYAEEAVKEGERINKSWEKLKSLKDEFLRSEVNLENSQAKNEPLKPVEGLESLYQEVSSDIEERQDMELLCEKIKENFEVGSSACVTMGELAEKINKLVN
ncbi:PROTEIN NETWORKED 2D [Salix purpurea]|uniref:PROTEIN NETWORKED 2D n=2 Tax=Salix TaxID=40685 RepID=A0A9Q0USQ7_SALPP|nr:PROTEIN NETWORKED 2D [Salix purpurea]